MSHHSENHFDLASAMEKVARHLLGEPNATLSSKDELRFGNRGSVSVQLTGDRRGTYFDNEVGEGGGVLKLISTRRGLANGAAWEFMRGIGVNIPLLNADRTPSKRIVASYDYVNAEGILVFQVVRFDPKDFRQRRPDGSGGWIWKIKGLTPVLYRLPDVAAAGSDQPIFIAEGEKDVDALRSLGLVATCNPGGAGKWSAELNGALEGRQIVILPDNDQAGSEHASKVAQSVARVAASVQIIQLPGLPPKGDPADWIAAGGTVAAMVALVEAGPDWQPLNEAENGHDTKGFEDLTEHGVAMVFAIERKDDLLYCHHAGAWYVWTGSRWQRNETKLAFSWARHLVAKLNRKAEYRTRAITGRASFAAAVERFAQADVAFAVTADIWDRDPWLLGTPAGTVDLKTGKLRAPERSDHITKSTAVAPAPADTPHPGWSSFLDQATNHDKDLQAFLQRLMGYCLTGDVTEETLAFLYGEGGTGKGTLLSTVVSIMGDYAVTVPIEVFTAGGRLNLEYYRAEMAGARLVTASETEAGATWAESQIKEMSGNETPLSGRHPYGKPFTFKPQFKIMLVGNHAPRLKGRSKAMERRMRIAPFKHKPEVPDHGLKERLRSEYPSILRWIIDGCLAWQRQRLGTCAAVQAETGTYFEQQDHFGRWLAERCNLIPSMSEKPSKLLADFLMWARESGEASITSSEFRELVERSAGLRYATNKGMQWVRGIGLKPNEAEQARADAERARYGDHDR